MHEDGININDVVNVERKREIMKPTLTEEQQKELMKDVNRAFPTGAQRDTGESKLRMSLLPQQELNRVLKRYYDGAEKYGENNWMKGMPLSVYYDSAMRHIQSWWNGEDDEDHASAVVWNMLCAMWTEVNIDQDDRYKYPREKDTK